MGCFLKTKYKKKFLLFRENTDNLKRSCAVHKYKVDIKYILFLSYSVSLLTLIFPAWNTSNADSFETDEACCFSHFYVSLGAVITVFQRGNKLM